MVNINKSNIDPISFYEKITNEDGFPTIEFINLWDRLRKELYSYLDSNSISGESNQIVITKDPKNPNNIIISLAETGVKPDSYGYSDMAAVIKIDKYGRIYDALQVPIGGLEINDRTYGKIRADRVGDGLVSSQISENAITTRELSIPTQGGSGKYVIGTENGRFIWQDAPSSKVVEEGCVCELETLHRMIKDGNIPFTKIQYGDNKRYSAQIDGSLWVYNPHATHLLVSVSISSTLDFPLEGRDLTIKIEKNMNQRDWETVSTKDFPSFLGSPNGETMADFSAIFEVPQKKAFLIRAFISFKGNEFDLRSINFNRSTKMLVQPFDHIETHSPAMNIFMRETDTRLLVKYITLTTMGDIGYIVDIASKRIIRKIQTYIGNARYYSYYSTNVNVNNDVLTLSSNFPILGFHIIGQEYVKHFSNNNLTATIETNLTGFTGKLYVSLLSRKGDPTRYSWPPIRNNSTTKIEANLDWKFIETKEVTDSNKEYIFNLGVMDGNELSLILHYDENTNVSRRFNIKEFKTSLKSNPILMETCLIRSIPVDYMISIPLNIPLSMTKKIDIGLNPFSKAELDPVRKRFNITFYQNTEVSWVSNTVEPITGLLTNPETLETTGIFNELRSIRFQAETNDLYSNVGLGQTLHCKVPSRHLVVDNVHQYTRYISFFEGDETDPIIERIKNNDWDYVGDNKLIDIIVSNVPALLYIVFAGNDERHFTRSPRGLKESWSESDIFVLPDIKMYVSPNYLYESSYSLKV